MENAAKALEIAAGVLLAVIIMSLIAYFFTNLSIWPEEQDNMETAEQLAKFNLEFEVYDKKGMYGTDVISCLAKAQSNNEKYYQGGAYLSGSKYSQYHWVNVYVNLKTDLEEEVTLYHYNRLDSGINSQVLQTTDAAKNHTMGSAGFIFQTTIGGKDYTLFDKTTPLNPKNGGLYNVLTGSSEFIDINSYVDENGNACGAGAARKYNAMLYKKDGGNIDMTTETPLQILIDMADSQLKQIVRNPDPNTLHEWSSAEWTTGLYDFKTRRFRCDGMNYHDKTGRVCEIYFTEI